jgi:Holliday junction resolvase YEN1
MYSSLLIIKLSIWLYQTQAIFFRRGFHAQAGENPELCVLFYRLARLVKLPVTAIFVFDGPKRPAIKRGKRVKSMPHWLTRGFKELIAAFGFHSHMVRAPFRHHLSSLTFF